MSRAKKSGLTAILQSLPDFRGVGGHRKEWAGAEEFVDLQVGRNCWFNVERAHRTQLWMSVLHRHRLGTNAAQSYPDMFAKAQKLPEEVAFDIEKDVNRTFPEVAKFATGKGVQSLMNVLKAYAALDPEVGYCQGMNFLAGVLLMYLPSEADAYGALVVLMQHRRLRELYKEDLAWLQVKLWQVGRLLPPKLAAHLEESGCLPVLYMSAWLLTVFASAFPLAFASRVMDVLLTDSYSEPMMKVSLGIMKACQAQLLEMQEMEQMVEFLKVEVPQWEGHVLQDILTDALSVPWSPAQVDVLEQTLGSETVLEAVKRNEADLAALRIAPGEPGAAAPPCSTAASAASASPAVSPPQTPTVITPLAPPPKWQARGSAQLGALVASPARAGHIAAPPRAGIGRRSVTARTSGARRDSGSARATTEAFGDFRRSAAAGQHRSSLGLGGTFGSQRSAPEPAQRAEPPRPEQPATCAAASSSSSPPEAQLGASPKGVRPRLPNGHATAHPPQVPVQSAVELRRALSGCRDMSEEPLEEAVAAALQPSTPQRRVTLSDALPQRSRTGGPVRVAPTGSRSHATFPSTRTAAASTSGLRPAGTSGNFASLVVGTSDRIMRSPSSSSVGSQQGSSAALGSSSSKLCAPGGLITQSMPAELAAELGVGMASLPSPTGSTDFSSADFAALLASGTAGIAAIPRSGRAALNERDFSCDSGASPQAGIHRLGRASHAEVPAGARGPQALKSTQQQMQLFEEFSVGRLPTAQG